MTLGYSATKREPKKHMFAFGLSSLPDAEDPVVDGDDSQGELDGNA